MNPKEKAKSLLNIMSEQTYNYQPYAGAHYLKEEIGYEAGKKCSLISIKNILTALNAIEGQNQSLYEEEKYWNEVKTEIENL